MELKESEPYEAIEEITMESNPFNGIERANRIWRSTACTLPNPFNGIERAAFILVGEIVRLGLNPFNGIESTPRRQTPKRRGEGESIQWN